MKKIIIFFIIFITIIILIIKLNVSYSNEKIDFSKYYLQGFFGVRNCSKLAKSNDELCEKTYFNIYDNRIFLKIDGDMTYFENAPDGTFNLNTDENSKIKIKIKNGYIIEFKLLSDLIEFKRAENIIMDDNYCEIAYLRSNFDVYNEEKKDKYFLTIGSFFNEEKYFKSLYIDNVSLLPNKINGKILVSGMDSSYIFPLPNVKLMLTLSIEDASKKIEPYKNKLKLSKNEEEPDIIIENCEIIYYNKNKLIFKTK